MKKNIESIISEIEQRQEHIEAQEKATSYDEGIANGLGISLLIIDQLDEQETLSKEWIDENITQDDIKGNGYVAANALYGILVPKQEITEEQVVEYLRERSMTAVDSALMYRENLDNKIVIEKPVIPKFVADYIQEGKELGCDLGTAMTVRTEALKDIRDYIKNNEELFAQAWLYGYTIKKEQKYYAKIKGWKNVTTGSEAFNWVYFKEKDTVGISKAVENKYQAVSFTKYDWNSLGINEDNADFLLVEELGE